MPPKPKCTKEQIVKAALKLVSERGEKALAARELGKKLGSSSCPIFTALGSMDELVKEVEKEGMRVFSDYIAKGQNYSPVFKAVGIKMLEFAGDNPNLFKFLFLRDISRCENLQSIINELGEMRAICIEAIKKDYELGEQDAQTLFVSEYIYCYGLSVLIATGKWSFEFEEACDLLGFQFVSALSLLKSDAPRIKTPTPQPKCKK